MIRQYALPSKSRPIRALNMLIAHASVHSDLAAAIGELNGRGLTKLEDEIQLGIDAGNIRAEVDCKMVSRMIYAYLRGQLQFAMLDAKFDQKGVAEEFVRALMDHLSPDMPAVSAASKEEKLPVLRATAASPRAKPGKTASRGARRT
ncbi:hypothetical protein D9M72_545640 [compost metagenome]